MDGSILCKDCITEAMIQDERYQAYTPPDDLGFDAEAELNHIAESYGIDRDDDEALKMSGFPVVIHPVPDTFCESCLWWFQPTNE